MLAVGAARFFSKTSGRYVRFSSIAEVGVGVGAAWSSSESTNVEISTSASRDTANDLRPDDVTTKKLQGAAELTAPWPFVDPSRPRSLPKLISREASPLPLEQAIRELQQRSGTKQCKFVEGVEAVLQLRVDTRRGDQVLRGSTLLPHGTGTTKRLKVCVFADGVDAQIARDSGADLVGGDELIASILASGGKQLPFDRCLATSDAMRGLTKLGRILGPRGLMPNIKMGTLVTDVARALAEVRGRLDYRVDKGGNVHARIGQVNMKPDVLMDNLAALLTSILENRPPSIASLPKSEFLQAAFLKGSMTATVPVSPTSILQHAALAPRTSKQRTRTA